MVSNALLSGVDLPQPGDVIYAKYRIESVVGTGGMGVVMGATDISLGRPVAIKFLSPTRATREGAVARFVREARAAAAIQSENVVRVFEVSTLPNGTPFLVMEHLRGADLAQLLSQRGALPIDEACDYILQVCEALGEAHGLGIVHRDLKPQNLFVAQKPDGSTCVKVLDFGISKAAADDAAPNLTSTDMVMGTPLYMSPEQVRSLKNVDARADIWALGSILFELLTMAPIYQAPSASALCAMIAMDPPTPLRARSPHAPAELEAVVLRCLNKDPQGRFQNVAELSDALAPFASNRGRQSAVRVSKVVRGGGNGSLLPGTGPGKQPSGASPHAVGASFPPSPMQLNSAAPYATTATAGPPPGPSFGPSFLPVQPGPSHYPGPHPSTQDAWHRTNTGTRTGEIRGKSSVLVAVLGVLTGLVLLAVLGGGAVLYVAKKNAALATAPVDASAPGAITTVPATATTVTASAVSAVTTPSSAPRTKPGPTVRDAGAPSAGKDGGGAPLPVPKPDDELAGKRQSHTAFCNHNQGRISDPNVSKATLESIKVQTCLPGNTPDGAQCERDICRSICLMLKDQMCLLQVDAAARNYPAKY